MFVKGSKNNLTNETLDGLFAFVFGDLRGGGGEWKGGNVENRCAKSYASLNVCLSVLSGLTFLSYKRYPYLSLISKMHLNLD